MYFHFAWSFKNDIIFYCSKFICSTKILRTYFNRLLNSFNFYHMHSADTEPKIGQWTRERNVSQTRVCLPTSNVDQLTEISLFAKWTSGQQSPYENKHYEHAETGGLLSSFVYESLKESKRPSTYRRYFRVVLLICCEQSWGKLKIADVFPPYTFSDIQNEELNELRKLWDLLLIRKFVRRMKSSKLKTS